MQPTAIKGELKRGRGIVATTILIAHALKHLYVSGQSTQILPDIKTDLRLTGAQYGSFGTISGLAWGSATMIAGYLGDRFTKRAGVMLAVSMALMGVSLFLMGFASGYTSILVILFIAGIGPAMFHPPAIGELSRRFPDRRGFAVSLHGMGANLGEFLGPYTIGLLLMFMAWRDILKWGLIPALIASFAILLLIPTREHEEKSQVHSIREYFLSLFELLNNKILLVLILTTALRNFGEGAIGNFLPIYLKVDMGYSPATFGLLLACSHIAGVITQPAMGFISDKIGRKPVLVTGTGLTMLSAFVLGAARPGPFLSSAFTWGGISVSLLDIVVGVSVLVRGSMTFSLHHMFVAAGIDAARGVAVSAVTSLIYGATFLSVVSPLIAGIIYDRYGIHSTFIYGGAVIILPTVILIVSKLPRSKHPFETE